MHRGLKITEDQRQRFVELYMTALDTADMPSPHAASSGSWTAPSATATEPRIRY